MARQLSDFNFDGYLFDPTISDKNLEKAFSKYEEFQEEIPKSVALGKLIRYIILLYDLSTEMNDVFKDVTTRKRECAILAGFEILDTYRFDSDVEDFIIGRTEVINNMIIKYVRLFNDPDYIILVSYWNMLLHEIGTSMNLNKSDGDIKESKDLKDTRINIDALNKHISELSKNIFRDDDNRNLRKALYKTMEKERLILRPEDIASQITKSKNEGKNCLNVGKQPFYPNEA